MKIMSEWLPHDGGRGRVMGIWTTNAAAGGVLVAAFMTYIHELGYTWRMEYSYPAPLIILAGLWLSNNIEASPEKEEKEEIVSPSTASKLEDLHQEISNTLTHSKHNPLDSNSLNPNPTNHINHIEPLIILGLCQDKRALLFSSSSTPWRLGLWCLVFLSEIDAIHSSLLAPVLLSHRDGA